MFTKRSEKREQYQLIKSIGAGKYAAVYLAEDSAGKKVAVKVPHHQGTDGKDSTKHHRLSSRIEKEAYFLEQTAGKHFVEYFDHRLGDNPYLVLEFMPETLAGLVEKNAVTQEVVRDYIKQIPSILARLREAQIAHCDLKCANFGYVPETGEIKVLDLGLAIHFEGTVFSPFNRSDDLALPPELRRGYILPQSDTYSAGRALEFMLTSEYGETLAETRINIELHHDLERLPVSIERFFAGMLSSSFLNRKSPEQLEELAQAALATLEKRDLFSPKQFARVIISDSGYLVRI